jgi:3-deoxy-7-phosphoheptulonate synthase
VIIILRHGATKADADPIIKHIESIGLKPLYLPGEEKIVLGAIGDERELARLQLESLDAVEKVVPILKPHKLVNREFKGERTIVDVGGVKFGGDQIITIAGPCAVESEEQIVSAAKAVKASGALALRGGAYKPRTSPYAFQGLEEEGLRLLEVAKEETGLPIITELLSEYDLDVVGKTADMFQIGARNMQNFRLLTAVGGTDIPVLLKRGPAATRSELLMAAEYIVSAGNPNVVLCERGIKSISTDTRNTFDLSVIPLLHQETHLPVIADPSHGTGVRSLVKPMALAAIGAGADGLAIEVHPDPEHALSDGFQQLTPEQFEDLMKTAKAVAAAVGRTI